MSAELRHIDFHGQQVPVLFREDEMFVPMRPRVEALGLDWSGQAAKFRSNPRKWSVEMISTVAADGCNREVLCLPLRKLDVWLLNLEPSRVKPEFREELEREQDELSQVLWAYRLTGAAIRPEVRAAAPGATRALFEDIEALTGLNPEGAQPGTDRYTWMNSTEAAHTLGVGRTALQYRCAQYGLPTRRWGNELQVPLEVLQAHFERHPIRVDVGRRAIPRAELLPDGLTVQAIRDLYGDATARSVLFRMNPRVFPNPVLEGGAR